MNRRHATKIVATLGPASSKPDTIKALYEAGADVFRLNFSHGTHDEQAARIDHIRALERQSGRPVAIIADLQGPKLRVGRFQDGSVMLEAGDSFCFDMDPAPGTKERVQLPHVEIFRALKPGNELLLDDGRLRLKAKKITPPDEEDTEQARIECEILVGGPLSNQKGVNVPSVILPLSAITEKDRSDLAFALAQGVEWIALSFVQRVEDVREARELINGQAWVISKLEKPSALDALEDIVRESDGIMVARGDLGVEMPPESVPVQQRRIISCCRAQGRPVVVATQMLDSMVERPVPTRAESSDVATAVYNGADAVTLSAESAAGSYPVESVAMMQRIITTVQEDPEYWKTLAARRSPALSTTPDAISSAARQMAETLPASAIVAYTSSGSTALRIARERPHAPIIALTPGEDVSRRLVLLWGVHSVRTPDARDMSDMAEIALHQVRIDEFAKAGDRIVITAGLPVGSPGKTNLIRILRVS